MNTIPVERPATERAQVAERDENDGRCAGRSWAAANINGSDSDEILKIADLVASFEVETHAFLGDFLDCGAPGEKLMRHIHGEDYFHQDALAFWEQFAGTQTPSFAFVAGFCEGVREAVVNAE